MEKKKADNNVEQNKKKSNSVEISLLIAFGVIAFYWLISYAVTSDNTKPISETNPSEKLVDDQQYFYNTFVKGCEKGGGKPSECQCMLTKVKQEWTFEEFKAIAKEYTNTNKLPEAMEQMATDCVEV